MNKEEPSRSGMTTSPAQRQLSSSLLTPLRTTASIMRDGPIGRSPVPTGKRPRHSALLAWKEPSHWNASRRRTRFTRGVRPQSCEPCSCSSQCGVEPSSKKRNAALTPGDASVGAHREKVIDLAQLKRQTGRLTEKRARHNAVREAHARRTVPAEGPRITGRPQQPPSPCNG